MRGFQKSPDSFRARDDYTRFLGKIPRVAILGIFCEIFDFMLRIRRSISIAFIACFLAGARLAVAQTTLPAQTQIQAELDTMPPAGGGFTPRPDGDSPFKISGQLQITYYPPKNEYDPNYGIPFSKEVTARYALATDITARYRDLPFFFRMYDFLALGRSLPQLDYDYDPTPIVLELQPTIGYDLNAN
jgi:hypothetical protein